MPDGKRFVIAAVAALMIMAADQMLVRKELAYVTSAGTFAYAAGSAVAQPVAPIVPASGVKLAEVNVTTGTTAINTINVQRQVKPQYQNAGIINVKDFGVKGDGTDETAAVQAALDAAVNAHVVFYIPNGMTVYVDVLTLANKSDFKIVIDGVLKRIAAGSPGRLLEIADCTDFEIASYNADGNIANNNNAVNEDQHLLSIVRSSKFHIEKINGKHPGGDVLYLSSCTDFQIDNIYGYAENTGRNCVSIINAQNGQFGKTTSIGVGYYTMPGGVDLEPNYNTDVVKNIQFGSVYIESGGTGAFSLSNSVNADCSNIIVDNLIVKKRTRTTGAALNVSLWIRNFNNVKIKGILTEDQSAVASLNTLGLYTDGGNDIELDLIIYNVSAAAKIGVYTATNNLTLSGSIYNIATYGIYVVKLTNSIIKSIIKDCDMLATGTWCAYFEYTSTITKNVHFQNAGFIKETYGSAGVRLSGKLTDIFFGKL